MGISDEKRREVARRMREFDVLEFKESAIVPFLECLGIGYVNWRGVLDELADLIDRPTCRMSDTGDDTEQIYRCSACGEEYCMSDVKPYPWRFCPNCGSTVTERVEAAMFQNFRSNPTLEAMLTFTGWRGGFSQEDKDALVESLDTIRTAMVQPVGATPDAKRRDSRCVTDAEFDRAVMVVLSTALTMWLSGALDKTPCVGDAE